MSEPATYAMLGYLRGSELDRLEKAMMIRQKSLRAQLAEMDALIAALSRIRFLVDSESESGVPPEKAAVERGDE